MTTNDRDCLDCKSVQTVGLTWIHERALRMEGVEFYATFHAMRCSACAAWTIDSAALGQIELAAAACLLGAGRRTANVAKFARKALGLTVEELASSLGVAWTRVDDWERGEMPLPAPEAFCLRELLLDSAYGQDGRTRDMLRQIRHGAALGPTERLDLQKGL